MEEGRESSAGTGKSAVPTPSPLNDRIFGLNIHLTN